MHRLSFRRAAAAGLAGAAAASILMTSGCAPATPKSVSGTISGADGRIVDAMLGFDVLDAARNKIDMGYLKVGYSDLQRLNYCVPVTGSTVTGEVCPNGKNTGFTWSLDLPANASYVYVEAYPKAPNSNDWLNNYNGYTGVAAGSTNMTRYGMAYRPNIPIFGKTTGISIQLPVVCAAGGTTGALAGRVSGWPGGSGEIDAWAYGSNSPALGFGIGKVDSNGYYTIPNLQSGQRYVVSAHVGGWSKNRTDTTVLGNATLVGGPCQTKQFNF